MTSPKGFSNQKMRGPARHQTIQTMGSDRVGIPTAQMYLYEKTAAPIGIISVTKTSLVKQTRKDQLTELLIEFDDRHGAMKFDIMRVMDGVLEGWEYEVIKVVDAFKIVVYDIGDIEGVAQAPEVGDLVKTLRWTTALSDQSGALQVSQGPLQFVKDSATVQVIEDTVDPTNNIPLPAGLYFYKNGVAVPVTDDTTDPNNVAAIPVEIKAVDGTNITITAGDINVQTSSEGVNFDSMRIGDGSGVFLKVEADGSINVVGIADILASIGAPTDAMQNDYGGDGSLIALLKGLLNLTEEGVISTLGDINGKDFSTAAKQDEAKAVLDTINGWVTAIGTTADPLPATLADPATVIALLRACAMLSELILADTTSMVGELGNINGNVADMSAKLPALLGQTDMDNSLAVTIANNQSEIPVKQGQLAASFDELLTIGTGAGQTIDIPAGAKWCKIQADDTNTANVRVKFNGAATISSGHQFQPGRSEDFQAISGATISVCAEAGVNQKLCVTFGV